MVKLRKLTLLICVYYFYLTLNILRCVGVFIGLSFAIPSVKLSKCVQNCMASPKCNQEAKDNNCEPGTKMGSYYYKCISSCRKTNEATTQSENFIHQNLNKKLVKNTANEQKRLKRGIMGDMGKRMNNNKKREIIINDRSQSFIDHVSLNRSKLNTNLDNLKNRRDKLALLLRGKQIHSDNKHVTEKHVVSEKYVTEKHVTKDDVTTKETKRLFPNRKSNNYTEANQSFTGFSTEGPNGVPSGKPQNPKCFQNCLSSTKCTPLEGHLHSCSHKASLERFLKCISSCQKKIPNGNIVHQELKKKFVEDPETNKRTNSKRKHSNSASVYKKHIELRKSRFKNIKSHKDTRTGANDKKRLKRNFISYKIKFLEQQAHNIKKQLREIIQNLKSRSFDHYGLQRSANKGTLNEDRNTREELQYDRRRNTKNLGNNGYETKRKGKRQIANKNENTFVHSNKHSPGVSVSNWANADVKKGSSDIRAKLQVKSKGETGAYLNGQNLAKPSTTGTTGFGGQVGLGLPPQPQSHPVDGNSQIERP